MLTQGPRDVHVRQQTLRNTIQWSYDLLSEQEQRLFRRLAIFVGGATLESIEVLYTTLDSEPYRVLDGIASLIDKSLLRQSESAVEEQRFLMLVTIREYGLEVLEASGEEQLTRQAHAQYYLVLAEGAEPHLQGPEQVVWFDRLEQELDNLRASLHWLLEREEDRERIEMALRLGGALYWFWFIRDHVSEGWTVLSRALDRSEEVAVTVRAKALWAAGWLAGLSWAHERAEALCQESLALYRQIGDTAGVAMATLILGIAALWQGQQAVAYSRFEESLALFTELGDELNVAWALYHLAAVAVSQGNYTKARLLAEESLMLFKKVGNTGAVAMMLFYLGQALFFQGDAANAQIVLEEGLALSKQIGHELWKAHEFGILGQVFLQQGKFAQARSTLEESLALWQQMGDRGGTVGSLCLLAKVEKGQGNHATARELYEEGLALSRDLVDNPYDIAFYLEELAGLVVTEGEAAWAGHLWGAAEVLRETCRVPLPPVYQADYEQAVAAARAQLGEQTFAAAWAEGRSMTVDQVLASRGEATIPPPHSSSTLVEKSPSIFPDGLTAREVEVLCLVAQGLSNAEIADQLIISLLTVKAHMRSLYNKLGISSRSAATRYAIEHQLV
jgi:ATP/maltotriose-dependent transcriptional regulator MalT